MNTFNNTGDTYMDSAPSAQNAVDIFKGEWSSLLPQLNEPIKSGQAQLFNDPRLAWAVQKIDGLELKTVLELGPLEGGHTFMLEKAGAAKIVSVEANVRAFLKCLISKEIYGLQKAKIECGDFVEYLKSTDQHFDVGIACGVLYHMLNPIELIGLLADRVQKMFVWTHYYDEVIMQDKPLLKRRFTKSALCKFRNVEYRGYRQDYNEALKWLGFCGGPASTSVWLTRNDILDCVEKFGFLIDGISFEEPNHVNGPCFAFVAQRRF